MYVNSRAIIERETAGGTEILLQVRDRPNEPQQLELPGGQIEEYESILGALAREVKEETGLTVTAILDETDQTVWSDGLVTVECLRPFCAYQTTQGPIDSIGFYFRVHAEGDLLHRGDGSYGHRWVPVRDLAAQVAAAPGQFSWLTNGVLQHYFRVVRS
ncbi:MAG TPA: NUDIX domain-containing protein [Symbiobacteriaceae bacterium]|nr:NUDIX domain-containing protein [Symbiobacteriaceae bacterium]